jgi:PAS domain S-box-containing protein
MNPSSVSPADDPLRDSHRIAAARRLLLEVPGPAAFDRLSALAARLVGADHAKVTLFTDHDLVVGGYGLPEGVVGGPALLTGALSAIVVRTRLPLNIPAAGEDPRVSHLPAVTSGQVQAYLGAPLIAASGQVVGALAVYDPVPRPWTGDHAELLLQLAASVVAELELSAAQSAVGASVARLEIALEASSVGIWEHDLRTGISYWDQRCAAIFGREGAIEFSSHEELLTHFHPEDHPALNEAMRVALEESGEYLAEARALRQDGGQRWLVYRGRVVSNSRGEPVRVLGTAVDVTDAREQAQRRLTAVQRAAAIAEVAAELANATATDQLAAIALRGAQVLGADSSGIAVHQDGVLRLHVTERLLQAVHTVAPEIEVPAEGFEVALDDSLPTQYVARHGHRVLLSDPDEAAERFPRMTEVNRLLGIQALAALPLRVEGRLLGSFVVAWTAEHQFGAGDLEVLEALTAQIALSVSRLQADAERAAAVSAMTEANRQLQLLADAGQALTGTLEITEQIEQLADLVVPTLGDWCWVALADEQGRLRSAAASHRDPARRSLVTEFVQGMLAVATDQSTAHLVTRSGRPMVFPGEHYDVRRGLPDARVQEVLSRLEPSAGVVVPLVAWGQALGAMGLVNGAERGPHTPAEVDTSLEIGRRAGLALHHARLFGQQRALADALQRSMLTDPPAPDHCEIVVRYVPAAAGAEIGGDWYDAFLQANGATVLAIGDVVGHDTRAAAAMGQVRGLLRGISYSSGGTPAEVLTGLDRALKGLDLDIMATAVVARLEQDDADRRDGRTRLRWSNAGHPPPIVVDADGKVSLLDPPPSDILLGVSPDAQREDHVVVLQHNCTVLLYTDGLVERRNRDIDAGTEDLKDVLRDCADLPLGALCDRVLARLFLPDAEDDVAVLAVRLHPEDRPRPATAGPQRVPPTIEPSPAVH